MKFDVVVIGDGIAAHAAAAVAARRGMTCMLLREPDTTGGRAAIFHKEGFTFDFGVLANRVAGAHPEIALKASGAPARFHPGGGALCFNGTSWLRFRTVRRVRCCRRCSVSAAGLRGRAR